MPRYRNKSHHKHKYPKVGIDAGRDQEERITRLERMFLLSVAKGAAVVVVVCGLALWWR